eukprot:1152842-Pelagomonas_calceolata.AAC.2
MHIPESRDGAIMPSLMLPKAVSFATHGQAGGKKRLEMANLWRRMLVTQAAGSRGYSGRQGD